MKLYVLSLGAGLLVGIVYSLLNKCFQVLVVGNMPVIKEPVL